MKEKKISVVTITLNRKEMLQQAIESVLAQDYPNFEHIVIDGGSTDGTQEMLKQYPHLIWISEPDSGQANAMNKGLKHISGEIFAWLNSDDCYPKGTFSCVNEAFSKDPEVGVVFGKCILVDCGGQEIGRTNFHPFSLKRTVMGFNMINTPATFVKVEALKAVGEFDESLRATYDVDMWIRLAQKYPVKPLDHYLSLLRLHEGSGLVSTRHHVKEQEILKEKYWKNRTFFDCVFLYPYLKVREKLYLAWKFFPIVKKCMESKQ